MTTLTIYVPRLNDGPVDFGRLAAIWRSVMDAGDGAEVIFDFSRCDFLRPNAVVFLGGLARMIAYRGGKPKFAVATMIDRVRTNLCQNGFAAAMGATELPWSGNSIPYREYLFQDEDRIIADLKRNWLGRGWINISEALSSAIAGQMWEIFANAFEHSDTPVGLYCCGQHLPKQHELLLAVADFGVGIPSNVRFFLNAPTLPAADAMRWAFTRGKSTAKGAGFPRGLGLDLLKEFVVKTKGRIQVYSHDGYARIDENGEKYENASPFFEGTLVQVRVLCDDKAYCLSNELPDEPFF